MSFSISGGGKPSEAKGSLQKGAENSKAAGLTEQSSKALDAVVGATDALCDGLPEEQSISITASGHFNDNGSGSATISLSVSAPVVVQ